MMLRLEFEEKCYEAYQLDWMLSHGYSLKDYLNALIFEGEEARENHDYPEGDLRDTLEILDSSFEYEHGFDGSIWVRKDEFLGAEFQDPEYMQHLLSTLPNKSEMLDFYTNNYHWEVT